jgi:DNA (cytosine-5)-methyltransferase 1
MLDLKKGDDYVFHEKDYENIQSEKLDLFKRSIGWVGDQKCFSVKVQDRRYGVNSDNNSEIPFEDVCGIGFFSGAGGLDIGAKLAGVEILAATDFDIHSIKTLSSNAVFKSALHIHEDIKNLSGRNFEKLVAGKQKKLILLGGPPCQPFSKAGYWITHEKRMGLDDPRNMISEYLRMISDLRPDGFILENVESLLHPKNIDQVNILEEAIDKLDYYFIRYVADARSFGVPQRRKRVFFIASKKKIDGVPCPSHAETNQILIEDSLPFERVVDWLWPYDGPDFYEDGESVKGKTYGYEVREIPPGQNYFALTQREGYPNPKFEPNKRFWNFLLKLHPFESSWTIPAQPGPWVGPFHWTGRRLRIPEISAIQTFPSDYSFVGSRREVQRQIGNAVPPLLAKAMVSFLLKNL